MSITYPNLPHKRQGSDVASRIDWPTMLQDAGYLGVPGDASFFMDSSAENRRPALPRAVQADCSLKRGQLGDKIVILEIIG